MRVNLWSERDFVSFAAKLVTPGVEPDERLLGPAPPSACPPADPLTDALLFLAAYHGRALSRTALLTGLPITDGKLSVHLFERAAQRAGLEVQAVKRSISEIPALVLPAVLVLRDGTTRILLEHSQDPRLAKVVSPPAAANAQPQPLGDDATKYLGYAFLARPASAADARTVAAGDLPKAHWFWSTVQRFWENYSHVAIAALIVNVLALASPLFIMNVYDRVVPNGAIPSLIALSIGLLIAIVFDFVLRMVRGRIIDVTGKKLDVVLAAKIFEHVQSVKLAQRPTSVGVLANQLRDFDSVREFFTSGIGRVAITDLLFAILFVAVLFIDRRSAGVDPHRHPADHDRLGFLLQRPLQRAMRKLQDESAARHGVLVESLNSLETVRAVWRRGADADPAGSARSRQRHAQVRMCSSGPRWR